MVAAVFGLAMAYAALSLRVARRRMALAVAIAYTLVAAGTATLTSSLWINLIVPGALLLTGYWLSGMLFGAPQAWLEERLLAIDRAIGAQKWMDHAPRPVAELLEAAYAADYVVVGGGAIFAATFGVQAVAYYWAIVLTAELASFAPLPWLRSRPPRAVEHGAPRELWARRFNLAILDNASVQANTLPSGHVAGATGAALAIMSMAPAAGAVLVGVAGVIAIAAIAGRYHYAVDCAAGAALAAGVWSVM